MSEPTAIELVRSATRAHQAEAEVDGVVTSSILVYEVAKSRLMGMLADSEE